ncbi:tetratricopeptide repeat protein [Roseococcus sp. YIM B11640]|uniref:tetratricopeptide repeat protein n=1 Tax=Roseococcus sp. YIM B11640 TaxID=3133973 RepID=UPI003C7A7ACF
MSDLISEVDEEMRAERARKLAQRFGGVAAVIVVLGLAGFAGWEGWRWHERREAAKAAETFLSISRDAAAEGADLRAVADSFEAVSRDAPAGYRTMARLRAAALLAETGQLDRALAAYDAIARDPDADQLYRDLATVMWGLHAVDTVDPAQVEARVTPLAADGAPWRASAREVLALAAIKRGNTDLARTTLESLQTDVATPQGLRDRAGRLLQGLGS